MSYIFHARIAWYQYIYLLLLGALIIYMFRIGGVAVALPCVIWLAFLIEKFTHTTYTVTAAGKLIIRHGRFSKAKIIEISRIRSVESRQTAKIGKYTAARYVLVRYSTDKFVSVLPVKEKEFLHLLLTKVNQQPVN